MSDWPLRIRLPRRLPPPQWQGLARECSIRQCRTLWAAPAPAALRHRATAVFRVAGNAGMGIGAALGGFIAAYGLRGFMALYLLNALTYLIYVVVLVALVREVT